MNALTPLDTHGRAAAPQHSPHHRPPTGGGRSALNRTLAGLPRAVRGSTGIGRALVVALAVAGSAGAQTSVLPPGTGTAADPYQISQLGHLVWMGDQVGASAGTYYTLQSNVDASATAGWNSGAGFAPIGNINAAFKGTFNGNGKVISHLSINRPTSPYSVGLFGNLGDVGGGGVVTGLGLEGCSVTGGTYVGGLVGHNYAGTISGCYATGTVTGNYVVGGLVGMNFGTLSACYATSAVGGGNSVGGLVGENDDTVSGSYATGPVTATGGSAGGLVGENDASVSLCYATGSVTGATQGVGGLVGFNNWGAIAGCYATGSVPGTGLGFGGLVGSSSYGAVNDAYWDLTTTGQAASAGGLGLPTAQMQQQATFVNWDFINVWSITENVTYPLLRSLCLVTVQADPAAGGGVSGGGAYAAGSNVVLLATAATGWQFVQWNDGVTNNPRTILVASNITYIANFAAQPAKIIGLGGSLAFGTVELGSTSNLVLTINNTGNTTLTVASIVYPAGFSGAWSGTVAAGGTTNVVVTFAPAAVTNYSGTVTVNADQTSGTSTTTASGTGVAASTRIIGLSGSLAFGSVQVGDTPALTLTISNAGNATLTVSGIAYPNGFSGAWSGTLAAGASTNVTVTFTPVLLTSYSGLVTVNADQTGGAYTASASGLGVAASSKILGLSGSLAFGSVQVGSTANGTLTIGNTGNTMLTVSSIAYPPGFSGNWSGTIAAGASTNVTVTFAPVTATDYSGTVTVSADQTSGTSTIPVSGAGVAVPTKIIALSGSLAFGGVQVGSTSNRTLTISNTGNATLTVSSIAYPAGFSGAWSGTIAAGGATNVVVIFAPVAVTNYSGTVTVNADQTSGANTTAASGAGVAVPTKIIALSGSLAFGSVQVGSTSNRTLTISNTGNATLTVSSIAYPAGFSGAWSGTIAAGGATNVVVIFAPVAVTNYSGTVTVNADQTSGANTTAASGAGVAVPTKIIALSGSLAFGGVQVGSTSNRTLTIGNTGNATLTVSSIAYPAGFSGAWSGTIAAGGATNVVVIFSPVAVTNYSGTVTVNADQTSGVNTAAASGAGVAVPTKIIALSGSLAFGGVQVGSTSNRTLTIGNTGNATLTVSSIAYPAGFSGAWSGAIAAGGATNVTVRFAPVAVTNYSGAVTVNADWTGGTNTAAASGAGVNSTTAVLTVLANPANGGGVTGGGTYAVGSNVVLAATASNLCRFVNWTDGATNNPRTVVVPAGGATYTANFVLPANIGPALDATNLNWMLGGSAAWFSQAGTQHGTATAAQSGAIGAGQTSYMQVTTNGPASLQFWWKISAAPANSLQFYINTQLVTQISGSADWNQYVTFLSTTNPVTLTWVYNKSSAAVAGSDAGWLDQVTWTPCPYATHVPQLFYQDPGGMLASWVLNSTGGFRFARVLANTGGWVLKAAGDIDGDGVSDLLFENAAGDTGGWFMNADGSVRDARFWFNIGAWQIRACADYEGTGRGQLFFQTPAGDVAFWRLDTNGVYLSSVPLGNMAGWNLRGAGDLDGDRKAELFWQNAAGEVAIWYHNPDGSIRGALAFSTGNWVLCGAADIDGDGVSDLLWQTPGGDTGGWFMNSNSTARAANFWWNTGAWKLRAAGR